MIIACAKCKDTVEASSVWVEYNHTALMWVVCEACKREAGISSETHMPIA